MLLNGKTAARAVMLVVALGLSACSNANRFDNGTGAGAGSGTGTGVVPGSANDPRSPAYFQQAVGDRVLFVVDSSALTDSGRTTLDGQARWFLDNADYSAVIEGHADEQGTREYNVALGARRANAVREYLLTKGVPGGRLRTVSFGKERPIEVCSSEGCYSKNRRAVTVLAGGMS